jgi:MFS superfamily sulfate permease-like transporter
MKPGPGPLKQRLRFLFHESVGALGDIGTFVPIAVAMVTLAGLDPATILVTAGLANIWGGVTFGIPIAVQPMKAIGAFLLAGRLDGQQVMAAGLCAAVAMLLVGWLGLAERVSRRLPTEVIRALQFTIAAELLRRGVGLAVGPSLSWPGYLSWVVAGAGAVLLYRMRRRLEWPAIGLLATGLLVAAWRQPGLVSLPRVTLWRPQFVPLGLQAWSGAWRASVAQIPLTFLNSVLAVSALARQLFPHRADRIGPSRLATSVGVLNLLICPLGAMPVCHGSGGLAGQYRLGARTGLSVILLGSVKFLLGFFFGGTTLAWMRAFPESIVGVFLVIAGWSLAETSKAWRSPRQLFALVVMVTVYHAMNMPVAAFGLGWLAWIGFRRWEQWLREWGRTGEGYESTR